MFRSKGRLYELFVPDVKPSPEARRRSPSRRPNNSSALNRARTSAADIRSVDRCSFWSMGKPPRPPKPPPAALR
jgi:hypothetical protein